MYTSADHNLPSKWYIGESLAQHSHELLESNSSITDMVDGQIFWPTLDDKEVVADIISEFREEIKIPGDVFVKPSSGISVECYRQAEKMIQEHRILLYRHPDGNVVAAAGIATYFNGNTAARLS